MSSWSGKCSRIPAALAVICLLLSGCASTKTPSVDPETALTLLDSRGHEMTFAVCPSRVVACSASIGEVWLDAGGTLVGITNDAFTERSMELDGEVINVGSLKDPGLERILSASPDLVLLSQDIEAHGRLAAIMEEASVPAAVFHEDRFEDYRFMLEEFTALTGREDRYTEYGIGVQDQIRSVLEAGPSADGKSALLLRAYSSGVKAKNADNFVGTMLSEFGLTNLLDAYPALTENISLEEIAERDPDYIFLTSMGKEEDAWEFVQNNLYASPLWAGLRAVKEGRVILLPRELFHYKPNHRWGEAYAYLAAQLEETE